MVASGRDIAEVFFYSKDDVKRCQRILRDGVVDDATKKSDTAICEKLCWFPVTNTHSTRFGQKEEGNPFVLV